MNQQLGSCRKAACHSAMPASHERKNDQFATNCVSADDGFDSPFMLLLFQRVHYHPKEMNPPAAVEEPR